MTDNLEIWNAVFKTPIEETKPITGKPYKGTSPDPMYMVRRATELFGPCGIGWGFNVIGNEFVTGVDGTIMNFVTLNFWYHHGGKHGVITHCGGTPFSGTRANGNQYSDEDAIKKSVTDALTKAFSMLGFAGDIFTGLYDDSKYVNGLEQEARAAKTKPVEAEPVKPAEIHKDATVDPATGEITPYRIEIDVATAKGQKVWVAYAQKLLAGIETATNEDRLNEWLSLNGYATVVMSKEAPKTHKRMGEVIGKKRDALLDAGKGAAARSTTIAPNAKDRAEQLKANPEANKETGEIVDAKRMLPYEDSRAAMEGLQKNIKRVGTPEAFEAWKMRARPAMDVMSPDHVAVLEEDIAAKEKEFVKP